MRRRVLAGLALCGLLAACATAPKPRIAPAQSHHQAPAASRPVPAPAAAPPAAPKPEPFAGPPAGPDTVAALPGWAAEDHVAALAAFVASCPVQADAGRARLCRQALDLGAVDDAAARTFLETHFTAAPIDGAGLLTGYYTPVYDARDQREGEFTAPVRPRPEDLPGRRGMFDYADRAQIEARPSRHALAWMRPEDLFFLQIQGSGVLVTPDGRRRRAVFDGANGAPFLGIAGPMVARGLLAPDAASSQAVHDWLAAHRGPEAKALMDLDHRYVFFRLTPDDGLTPVGAAGAHLDPGRALAVDPTSHAMGEVLWIDGEASGLAGAFPTYRRLAVALDVGSAIRGPLRADLYVGEGAAAGVEAGRIRHSLRLYRLEPRADEGP